jgi:hypothetical protein
MRRIKSLAVMGVLLLGACTVKPSGPSPDLTFSHVPQQAVTASFITIERTYDPFAAKDDVAMHMAVAPHVALERYLAQRFRADGAQTDSLKFTIEEGRVTLREIPQANSLLSAVNIGTQDEYTVRMKVKIQPYNADNIPGAGIEHRFERTLVMPQNVSLAEREMRQVRFVEQMIQDMDAKIVASLRHPLRMIP